VERFTIKCIAIDGHRMLRDARIPNTDRVQADFALPSAARLN
jgi:hypothetical protein